MNIKIMFRFDHLNLVYLETLIATILLLLCTYSHSAIYTESEFNQKLDSYIKIVNETKSVLDDPNAQPASNDLKVALCQRIQAYKNILQLSEMHLAYENAQSMRLVSQMFLDRQDQSFINSGLNETVFCSTRESKTVSN